MDPLSRWLDHKMATGLIRGLKVANSAPTMACSMFADDLILMGRLSESKVQEVHLTLTDFSLFSGLKINRSKSKVWFSKNTDGNEKEVLLNLFGVQEASGDERYLGAPVSVTANSSFDYLIEQFEQWLNH